MITTFRPSSPNHRQRQILFPLKQSSRKVFVLSIHFLFFIFANAQSKNEGSNSTKIIGTWVSVDDVKNQIVFTKKAKLDYYDKALVSTYSYTINGDALTATDQSDGTIYRYSVLSLTEKNLTLIYLDRGNLLKFKRSIRKK